ncbi:MAG: glycosyltransferase family protein [Selenomonadaceae bacterium]|nr:glycosyltransferase family protein [Selenomonadaceae bacterium]
MNTVDDKKVAFISCVNNDEWYSECKLYVDSLSIPDGMKVETLPIYNAPSMCAGYNEAMGKTDAKYKVYIHQDTLVVNKNLIGDIVNLFADKSIGLIGVIGCKNLPKSGVWWDGLRTYGRVLHACEPESVVDSECKEPDGEYEEVEAVDGLFLATQYDIPWRDDLFTGWHLYDTSECMEMKRRGLKVVVPNQKKMFWCVHCPEEKPLAHEYKGYQRIFIEEYGMELNPEV